MRCINLKIIKIVVLLSLIIHMLAMPENLFAENAQNHETPGNILASEIFSENLLKGPDHIIQKKGITYNGFTNRFLIQSRFGRMIAVGNGMVPVRVQEIQAIAKLEEVKKSKSFVDGLKESGGSLLETSKNLVIHPVDTISGVPSGLYNIFADTGVVVGNVVKGEATLSEGAEKGGKAVVGFSRNKRELAYSLGVDLYSNNKVLQEYLNSVSWATTGGSFTVDLAKMAVPGAAGLAISAVGSVGALNKMVRDNTPAGLHRINEDALEDAGIEESAIDRFLANRSLTPRHQTAITNAVVSLTGAKNREAFLNLISRYARTAEDAYMYQAVATMIAAYNRGVAPIKNIGTYGNVVAFKNDQGSYVLTYPVDHFFWTERIANKSKRVTEALPAGRKKELWISGRFSDLSSQNLQKLGWFINDQALEKLKVDNLY